MQAPGLLPPPSVLRADSTLPEQPGSAKMVSLDLLLGAGAANSTPATPRDPDTLLQVRRLAHAATAAALAGEP